MTAGIEEEIQHWIEERGIQDVYRWDPPYRDDFAIVDKDEAGAWIPGQIVVVETPDTDYDALVVDERYSSDAWIEYHGFVVDRRDMQ